MSRPRRSSEEHHLTLYTDGAARGNPGPGGAAAVIRDPRKGTLATRAEYLGRVTNNVAEYSGLLLGLACARELGATSLDVRSDSELMIRQMRGEYRVRNPRLRALHTRARELERSFRSVRYVHVPRERNREADRLANDAIDAATDLASDPIKSQNN